jgi:hypothetical protein
MERYEKMMQANIPKPTIEPAQQPTQQQAMTNVIQPQPQEAVQPKIDLGFDIIEPEATPPTSVSNVDLINAAKTTVNWEGRRDKKGNLSVYALPAGDMGGDYEVAGINDRYHPEAFRKIAGLPAQNRESAAAEYISQYTAPLVSKLPPAIQPFTQDLAFNRGLGGATKYIQEGLNSLGVKVAIDGAIGPKTLAGIEGVNPKQLMIAASQAQLNDERARASADPRRKKFIAGLENRINNRLNAFGGG